MFVTFEDLFSLPDSSSRCKSMPDTQGDKATHAESWKLALCRICVAITVDACNICIVCVFVRCVVNWLLFPADESFHAVRLTRNAINLKSGLALGRDRDRE